MQAGMESCLTKSIMAGGMGFALGGAFGLFMSSVRQALLQPTRTNVAAQFAFAHRELVALPPDS